MEHPTSRPRFRPVVQVGSALAGWLIVGGLVSLAIALVAPIVVDRDMGGFVDHRGSATLGGGQTVYGIWRRGPCTVALRWWSAEDGAGPNESMRLVPPRLEELFGSNWPLKDAGRLLVVTSGWPCPALHGTAVVDLYSPGGATLSGSVGCWNLGIDTGVRNWMNQLRVVPYAPLWDGVAINAVVWALALLGIRSLWAYLRRLTRAAQGRCTVCGHSRGPQLVGVCPECGAPARAVFIPRLSAHRSLLTWTGLASCVCGAGAVYMARVWPDLPIAALSAGGVGLLIGLLAAWLGAVRRRRSAVLAMFGVGVSAYALWTIILAVNEYSGAA